MEASNPAQQEILKFCARLTNDDVEMMPLGTDGCGIPVFATSLHQAALAFMRFATLEGIDAADAHALRTVRDAMTAAPWHVSGTDEFDAALMDSAAGSIACKAGAEGVHGDAVIESGTGLVLKVVDGAKRAVAPAALACLDQLGELSPAALTQLKRFVQPQLTNRGGRVVGEICARRAILAGARTE